MIGTTISEASPWMIPSKRVGLSTANRPRTFRPADNTKLINTYQGHPSFVKSGPTVLDELCLFIVSSRPEETVVAKIREFGNLQDGWDGELARKPEAASIASAVAFVRLLGADALNLEPTLHADGSVILETHNSGSIRFLDNGLISAVVGRVAKITAFDGSNIDQDVLSAINE